MKSIQYGVGNQTAKLQVGEHPFDGKVMFDAFKDGDIGKRVVTDINREQANAIVDALNAIPWPEPKCVREGCDKGENDNLHTKLQDCRGDQLAAGRGEFECMLGKPDSIYVHHSFTEPYVAPQPVPDVKLPDWPTSQTGPQAVIIELDGEELLFSNWLDTRGWAIARKNGPTIGYLWATIGSETTWAVRTFNYGAERRSFKRVDEAVRHLLGIA